jgi:hypothetical protein
MRGWEGWMDDVMDDEMDNEMRLGWVGLAFLGKDMRWDIGPGKPGDECMDTYTLDPRRRWRRRRFER